MASINYFFSNHELLEEEIKKMCKLRKTATQIRNNRCHFKIFVFRFGKPTERDTVVNC